MPETKSKIESFSPPPGRLMAGHFRQSKRYSTYRSRGTRDWLLIFTRGGQGAFGYPPSDAQGRFTSRRGDLVLLSPGTLHDYGLTAPGRPWELQWAHFLPRAEWIKEGWLRWPEIAPGLMRLHARDEAFFRRLSGRFSDLRLLSRDARRGDALAMNALEEILLWCDGINPLAKVREIDPRIARVLDHVTAGLDGPLPMAGLASRGGLSVSRMAHLFEAEMGMPPRRYIEAQRMREARRLLERTALSVGEVARSVGFESPFYFSLRFKASVGVGPLACRRRARAGE